MEELPKASSKDLEDPSEAGKVPGDDGINLKERTGKDPWLYCCFEIYINPM